MKKLQQPLTANRLLITGMTFLLLGCLNTEEYDFDKVASIKWNPKYAIPLVTGQATLNNLLNEEDSSTLFVYDDGLYYLVYEDQLESSDIGDMVDIRDKVFYRLYDQKNQLIIPPNTQYTWHDSTEILDLGTDPEQITQAVIRSGYLSYRMETSINSASMVKVIFPSFLQNGQVFELNMPLGGGDYQVEEGVVSLAGLQMDLSTFQGYNDFPVQVITDLETQSQADTTFPGDYVRLTLNYNQLKAAYLEGFFGQQSVGLPQGSISIGPFGETFGDANVHLESAKISLIIKNEYGIPMSVEITEFGGIKSDGTTMDFQTQPSSPIFIEPSSVLGSTAVTRIEVTNAADVFNFEPDNLLYRVIAHINPQNTPTHNFLIDTAKITFDLRAELPLYGTASNIVLEDTMEISMSETIDEVEVEKALMKILLQNEFPLEAEVQFYLTDNLYQVTDSLFSGSQKQIVRSAPIDQSGERINDQLGIYDEIIEIDGETFKNLLEAEHLILKAALQSRKDPDGTFPSVKIKQGQRILVDLGIQTHLDITINP